MINLLPKYLENRVNVETFIFALPGVGNEWTLTVPANKLYIPINFYGTLTTDASVANRIPRISHRRAGVTIARTRNTQAVTASVSQAISANVNSIAVTSSTGGIEFTMPLCRMIEGDVLQSDTISLQAGDQYVNVVIQCLVADITEPS